MPRRVLFVAWAPFFSGAERALVLTIRSLDRSRFVPHVLAGTDGEFCEQIRAEGVACDVAALQPVDLRRPFAAFLSVAAVIRQALRHHVSLIHANEAPSFRAAGYAARLLRIPAVTHIRFPDSDTGYRWFLRPGFSRALFVSRALFDDAHAAAPRLFDGRSEVLHDCVQPQAAWTVEDTSRMRGELGLPADAVIVAITGQIAEVKGIWDFVDAARRVEESGRQVLFAVLGDDLKTGGAMRRAMEARVAALGLANRFEFLGFRPDAPRIIQAFDVIVVPSHVEPLGNATLEAMAAGRPVIGSRVGGIPEMVVDNVTGLLVPPRAPDALAKAIARLADDPSLRARMGAAARTRSADVFGGARHSAQLQELYDELCSARERRDPANRRRAGEEAA